MKTPRRGGKCLISRKEAEAIYWKIVNARGSGCREHLLGFLYEGITLRYLQELKHEYFVREYPWRHDVGAFLVSEVHRVFNHSPIFGPKTDEGKIEVEARWLGLPVTTYRRLLDRGNKLANGRLPGECAEGYVCVYFHEFEACKEIHALLCGMLEGRE